MVLGKGISFGPDRLYLQRLCHSEGAVCLDLKRYEFDFLSV